jgi:hypothetical protein
MTMDDQPSTSAKSPKPRRRWFQFSLRTLLVGTVLLSCAFAFYKEIFYRVHQQRRLISKIEKIGGRVGYDDPYRRAVERKLDPPGSPFVRWLVGNDAYASVEHIDLRQSGATDKDLDTLTEFPKLNAVSIDNRFTQNGLISLAKNQNLSTIVIYDMYFDEPGLKPLASLNKLKSLHLLGTSVDDRSLRNLGTLTNLEFMQLNGGNGCDISSEGLARVSELPNLMKLHIFNFKKIDRDGIHALAKSPKLKELALYSSSISDNDLEYLGDLKELKQLSLVNNSITLASLDHLKKIAKLDKLTLSFSLMDNAGIASLRKSALPISGLILEKSQISDTSIEDLLKIPTLMELDLQNTNVTAEGIKRLAKAKQLSRLLIGPKISADVVAYLQLQLPQCYIFLNRD